MNPVLITIYNYDIMWYSVLILIAVVMAFILFLKEGRRFNYNKDFLFNLAFWTVISGFVGARLYYVIFKWELYKTDLLSIFKVWEGGLAIHGGIIFGLLAVVIYSRKYNTKTTKLFDMGVVALLLAQAIGRWGNFFNSEAYGSLTSLARLKELHIPEFIINGMFINGNYYHPTFFYESMWCLAGVIILLIIRRIKTIKIGQMTSFYLIWYGIGRFMIESLRTDSLMLGGFKTAQIISIIMIVIGVMMSMVISRKSKYESLYNTEEKAIFF